MDDGEQKFYQSTALDAEYVLTSRFPKELLNAIIHKLKGNFIRNFSIDELNDNIDIEVMKSQIESVWKKTV